MLHGLRKFASSNLGGPLRFFFFVSKLNGMVSPPFLRGFRRYGPRNERLLYSCCKQKLAEILYGRDSDSVERRTPEASYARRLSIVINAKD